MKKRVAVLISGSGTNLQALIDACEGANYPAQIVGVLSNKEDAYGLSRAEDAGISTAVISHKNFDSREAFDDAMHGQLEAWNVEIVCLAGFMRLLSPEFTKKWQGKMINIHPSLLPLFKGANAHQDALDAGVEVTGCTVHFVVPEMDAGPIILQDAVEVLPEDDLDDLRDRLLPVEHGCYVEALELLASGSLVIEGDKVIVVKAKTDA